MGVIFQKTVDFIPDPSNYTKPGEMRLTVSESNITSTKRTLTWKLEARRTYDSSYATSSRTQNAYYTVSISSYTTGSKKFNFDMRAPGYTDNSSPHDGLEKNVWHTWASGSTEVSTPANTTYNGYSCSAKITTDITFGSASLSGTTSSSKDTYKITFNANGGSLGDVPSYQTKVEGTNLTLTSKEPTRSGYSFEGWGTSSSSTTASYQPGSSYKTDAAITLYAIWKSENGKTTFYCDSTAYFLDHIHLKFYKKNSSNTQTIVWKSSNGATFTSHEKNTLNTLTNLQADYSLSATRFQNFFDADQDSVDVTITVTTYNSAGTSLGSASRTFTMIMREADGRPSAPSASVSRTATGATITLTRPSTYKYGATFKGWYYTYNYGKSISLSGNTITAERYDTTNQTHVIQVWAVDSRGFISDKIDVVWYVRRKGPCVYQNGAWRAAKPRLYTSDSWTKRQAYVYNGSEWKRSKI